MLFKVPSIADVNTVRSVPTDADGLVTLVGASGSVPKGVGLSRSALKAVGFEGKVGQTLLVPGAERATVIVGSGEGALSPNKLRDGVAAGVRGLGNRSKHIAVQFGELDDVGAQAVVEGALLASYRYVGLKTDDSIRSIVETLSLVVPAKAAKVAGEGAARGAATARAQYLARELANTPPGYLNATDLAEVAISLAPEHDLDVEVFNADQLKVLGCGGILGVNSGSVQPPRMIKLTYAPKRPKAQVALVGKGITYDSGGISLKPTNEAHASMKMDMSGAAAVLAAMTTLAALGCRNKVTAWLMCTDNMPSGSAMKLGDVLTIRNGTTVEIHNTDAEGRLVLADGLSLAAETEPDVIADIATLTGAAMAALGTEIAAALGNDDDAMDQAKAASAAADEPIWELPLAKDRYKKMLDSEVADMRNVGGPYAGTVTASIFLSAFVGDTPWVHLDIAGPMAVKADSGWKSKGATGFGARLLSDFALNYTATPANTSAK